MNIQSISDYRTTGHKLAPKGSVSVQQRKTSEYLPKGAQGQLIDAAILAEIKGYPLDHTTTIRLEKLAPFFAGKHGADVVTNFLVLLRKWHVSRGVPWFCIWSREVGKDVGHHLHICHHLSEKDEEPYIDQVARWTGESRIFLKLHKPASIGISEHSSWLVQKCLRGGWSGVDSAAYLGKDEPSFIKSAWRVQRDNKAKRNLKHLCNGGYIEGRQRCAFRHGTSRNIAPTTPANKAILKPLSDKQRLIRADVDLLPY